jgi:hypothetical protein
LFFFFGLYVPEILVEGCADHRYIKDLHETVLLTSQDRKATVSAWLLTLVGSFNVAPLRRAWWRDIHPRPFR